MAKCSGDEVVRIRNGKWEIYFTHTVSGKEVTTIFTLAQYQRHVRESTGPHDLLDRLRKAAGMRKAKHVAV